MKNIAHNLRPTLLTLALAAVTGSLSAGEAEDLRRQGDDSWNRAGNIKVPKPGSAKVVGWGCPKCNRANTNMNTTVCRFCGHDYAPPASRTKPTRPAAPVFTPAKPTHTPSITTPGITSPDFSNTAGFRPFHAPPAPALNLPKSALSDDKDKEAALLAGIDKGRKPKAVAPEPKGVVDLLRPASPKISPAEWDKARSLTRQVDAINAKGWHVTREELDTLESARRKLGAFYAKAIYQQDLTADERERLKLSLHYQDDTPTRAIVADAPPRRGLMQVIPPPPPTIDPGPPSAWAKYKEDAATVGGFIEDESQQWLNKSKSSLNKFKHKFEVRTPTAVCAVRG